jgi:hypothetical protein
MQGVGRLRQSQQQLRQQYNSSRPAQQQRNTSKHKACLRCCCCLPHINIGHLKLQRSSKPAAATTAGQADTARLLQYHVGVEGEGKRRGRQAHGVNVEKQIS